MLIGAPKEIKDNEFRVGLTPATVAELTHRGHGVIVEKSAGIGSGLADDEYRNAGAKIVDTPQEMPANHSRSLRKISESGASVCCVVME